jgi:transposase
VLQGREDVGCKVGEPVEIVSHSKEFFIMPSINEVSFVGIDVSAKTLDVTVLPSASGKPKRRRFDNDSVAHVALILWLNLLAPVRVVCEATGVYHLDLAYALHHAGIAVMVVNPRRAKRFIEAQRRNTQTDSIDADELAQFAKRMDFVPWKAPSDKAFAVHKLGRAIGQMTKHHTAISNRLHAAQATSHTPGSIINTLKRELVFIERERQLLFKECNALIAADPDMANKLRLLMSTPGIAEISAPAILAELIILPDDASAKAWTKYAGLDPASKTSGTSVHGKTHIAKHGNPRLRGALFLPALSARTHDPLLKAFADRLVANHKTKLQAIVAIQRKLLHSIHAMFKTNSTWNKNRPSNTQKALAG